MPAITKDPAIINLLNRMPKHVQASFSDEQLSHLKVAIGARQWGKHALDCRGVIKFFKYRYYFVILAGRNRRELSQAEKKASRVAQAIVVTISLFTILLILYLIKSVLGINVFEGFSFGIWSYFKELLV
ncbi:hypothetical protein F0Z19_1177 [Vibrio cyclitrophicus]|nr:hypothetical protein F0Z19_1177 [Vibrio cyclitrophicus]